VVGAAAHRPSAGLRGMSRLVIVVAVMADPLAAFAYEQATKTVTDQASALEELRSRAGTLLSTAALATSFLGGLTLVAPAINEAGVFRGARIGGWAWGAISAFLVVAGLTLTILWPYTWRFTIDPVAAVKSAEAEGMDLDELKWDLALYQQANWIDNDKKLAWLYRVYHVGIIALVLEITFWVLDIQR
jgi:hypothetical protein